MVESKRIGRNIGRIELLAVMTTVKGLLEAGYDRKKIHCRLMEENSLTMSYPTFCYQLKQLLGAPPVSGRIRCRSPKHPACQRSISQTIFLLIATPNLKI